jgi:hypothetical protein
MIVNKLIWVFNFLNKLSNCNLGCGLLTVSYVSCKNRFYISFCLPFGLRFQLPTTFFELRRDKTTQQVGKADAAPSSALLRRTSPLDALLERSGNPVAGEAEAPSTFAQLGYYSSQPLRFVTKILPQYDRTGLDYYSLFFDYKSVI